MKTRSRIALTALGCLAAIAALWFWSSLAVPEDSPLARMYRTEADLAALVTALETYRDRNGAYPPSGPDGLKAATDALSERVNFFPDGPPIDAWGRAYRYMVDDGDDTYALFSGGVDESSNADDITLDKKRPWRPHYRALQRTHRSAGENPDAN